MRHSIHLNNNATISRQTPLSTCFPSGWSEHPNWESAAPRGMKSAWLRRLSWQERDVSLSKFVSFLEQNGETTHLDEGEWQGELNKHLIHKPNRHLFFLLIARHLDAGNFLQKLHLETDSENLIIQWKKNWKKDISLTAEVEKICMDNRIKEITRFRDVSICEAMTYPTFRTICCEQKLG